MWDNVVKRLVGQVKDPELPANENDKSMEEDQRRKKKGRITWPFSSAFPWKGLKERMYACKLCTPLLYY